jgi:hypothetical protein
MSSHLMANQPAEEPDGRFIGIQVREVHGSDVFKVWASNPGV